MTNHLDARFLIPEPELGRLLSCRHHNPHDIYGWHEVAASDADPYRSVIRTRHIGAERVELITDDDQSLPMTPIGHDIFVIPLQRSTSFSYQLRIHWHGGTESVTADPYTFLPTLGEMDLHLINEGRHERLWEVLGSHVRRYDSPAGEVTGVSFAVWAPNAQGVAVIGDFNGWNCCQHPMRSLGSTGVWEVFIPTVTDGAVYKFAVHSEQGRHDKADPVARRAEIAPSTGSIVCTSNYQWRDDKWIADRATANAATKPMSIYEVHLGSWQQGENYTDLARSLVPYVKDMGYTHVEFMPVAEHPFGGSWGYQVTGYYAPTSRWGDPDALRFLIDEFHAHGIGVIVDWVPAHFPKDEWALARFDGQPLYEHADWRRGEQVDWGTYVFDFGRPEVRNFLVANALYWIDQFHVDGLRVDAVASMLYLDYSRKEGEWVPNEFGGRENLEAVQFLQEMNATVHKTFPGVVTVAEESTSWPGVTAPTDKGGLGFSMKWNMGWMNDTLSYCNEDPINRSWHHNKITFSLVYAYTERFILPISHDEVVHGKGSLWERMPGDAWNKAAGVRTLLAYMWAHPGKKLLFQGLDFAQKHEWSEARSLDWHDCDGWEGEYHRGVKDLLRQLNEVLVSEPALFACDDVPEGFTWVKSDDAAANVLAFTRQDRDGNQMLCVCNFGGSSHLEYTMGMPESGTWSMVVNTDAGLFGGADCMLPDTVESVTFPWDGQPNSLTLHLPAMSTQLYKRLS